jgi:hypothetical protein
VKLSPGSSRLVLVHCNDPISSVALAFAPDGALLVAYAVPAEVRALMVGADGAMGPPVRLGPASEITKLAAEIAPNGRALLVHGADRPDEVGTDALLDVRYSEASPRGRFSPSRRLAEAGHEEDAAIRPTAPS